ncbi:hypothetical protein L917_08139 [Phytophthora nicotianae]|uniref:Uncharacterized protein n=1 Tax=Phytophthora nicotianae TaxID=4792 RepID=W2LAV7_PHYNI|nr:hypothetical protein L915_08312 [Phytophthora nicotianae]ETL40633.1 hypothetical protein L916_08241 [Phytophthora nicotianae]ETL93780.1 hypothetical protein L917_08139 [Phytophthora nicotianae]ETM47015.1 hypothetical protein L914_08202 [Phytophthora nicotianae]
MQPKMSLALVTLKGKKTPSDLASKLLVFSLVI